MVRVARLTDTHLLKTVASFPKPIQEDPTNRTFYLSLAVVRHFLGAEWADEHVQDNGRPGYVRLNWRDQREAQIKAYRIADLAEILINLQHVEGLDDCLQRMKDGDIEGTYAELDLGRMLFQGDIAFRFVKPSLQKREDYDIEITMSDGLIVCADGKCKIETTQFSEQTITNSLKRARSQFPNRPSIVFVKVPPRWMANETNMKERLTDIANEFLRGTGRIVSVKYYSSYIHWENAYVTHIQAFHEINNTYSINRFGSSRNWDMFEEANENVAANQFGEFTDVPGRWRRLMYYPDGISQ